MFPLRTLFHILLLLDLFSAKPAQITRQAEAADLGHLSGAAVWGQTWLENVPPRPWALVFLALGMW